MRLPKHTDEQLLVMYNEYRDALARPRHESESAQTYANRNKAIQTGLWLVEDALEERGVTY